MADTKITALTSISTSTDPANDVFPIVDISDNSITPTGTTKKVTTNQLLGAGGTASFGTLTVTGTSTLTGAATVQGLTVGKGASAVASNTAMGISALAATDATSSSNSAFGVVALQACVGGGGNSAFGHFSLNTVVSGNNNNAIGLFSARILTGSENTAIGSSSLTALGAGNDNTAVGYSAGSGQTSGSNNGFFGANCGPDIGALTASNRYYYGDSAVASHKFGMGNLIVASGNVMIGVATAGAGATLSLQLANTTAPTAQIAGGQLFVVSGVLKYMDSAGVVKTVTMV